MNVDRDSEEGRGDGLISNLFLQFGKNSIDGQYYAVLQELFFTIFGTLKMFFLYYYGKVRLIQHHNNKNQQEQELLQS